MKLTERCLGLEGAGELHPECKQGDQESCDGIRTLDWRYSEHKEELGGCSFEGGKQSLG